MVVGLKIEVSSLTEVYTREALKTGCGDASSPKSHLWGRQVLNLKFTSVLPRLPAASTGWKEAIWWLLWECARKKCSLGPKCLQSWVRGTGDPLRKVKPGPHRQAVIREERKPSGVKR